MIFAKMDYMEAILKVKITPEYLAVKYNCKIESNQGKEMKVLLDNNRLGRMIQKDMVCDILFPDASPLNGVVRDVETHDGKIRLDISKPFKRRTT